MKVLHTTASLNPSPGIINQMQLEQEAADQLQLSWKTRCFCPADVSIPETIAEHCQSVLQQNRSGFIDRVRSYLSLRREYYQWLLSQEATTDVFLLRHYPNDPMEYWFIRRCKRPVLLVHHTLEMQELATEGLTAAPRIMLERYFGARILNQADGIVGVTEEIIDYELKRIKPGHKPTILYPNGILFDEITSDDQRSEVPELIFVAGHFAPWHGLDLLLADIEKSDQEFVLHIVGQLDQQLLQSVKKDSRIQVHGLLSKEEIRHLSSKCWVGLSSFGLFRNNMEQACTLKVREYLALGLPVYAGYKDVFPPDFSFYRKGDASISGILDFAESLRTVSRTEVSGAARPFIDKAKIMETVYARIQKLLSEPAK